MEEIGIVRGGIAAPSTRRCNCQEDYADGTMARRLQDGETAKKTMRGVAGR